MPTLEQTPSTEIPEKSGDIEQHASPLQAEVETWAVWNNLDPKSERLARGQLATGIAAFTEAEQSDKRDSLTGETIKRYEQASHSLVDFRAITYDELREPEVADAVILTMVGTALARRAQADELKPYGGIHSNIDPRSNLRQLAHRNLKTAREIFTAHGNYEAATNVFEIDDPVRAVAQAAIKAELTLDTNEYAVIDDEVQKETTGLLKSQGEKGVARMVDRKDDPRFLALFGRNILDEMVESPEVISVG